MVEILLLIMAVGFFARRGRGKGPAKADLPAVLAGAEAAGIITAGQREQLLAYAGAHAPSAGRLGAAWLGIFAGLFVVAGVSLLVARNWESIGPVVRVGVFLAVLVATGEGAIRTRARGVAVALPLELLWLFLPLLGIGLYGQTFQLSGDPIQPFLLWLALTAPLAWLSPRPVAATLHTFALVAVLFAGNFMVDAASGLFTGGLRPAAGMLVITGESSTPSAWVLSVLLLAVVAVQSLRLLPRAHRHHFVGVWAVWLFAVLIGPTTYRLHHEGWMILAALALATLWIVALTYLETSFEERATAIFVWVATMYALTFTWHMSTPASGETTAAGRTIVEGLVGAAVVGALALPGRRLSPAPAWALGAKVVLVAPLLVATLYLGTDMQLVWLAAAAMNVLLVVIAVGAMWHGSLVGEAAQVNVGVLVLVAILVTRFIDVLGNMLQSGIGLIAAGLLLAGLAWGLERTWRRLIETTRGAAS